MVFLPSSHAGRRGSVLVLVLGLVTLAAFLLSRFIERSVTEMLVESRARQSDRLRVEAHSALETSLAVLAEYQAVDGGLRAPAQGWGEPLAGLDFVHREGTAVSVEIEDESGRLSLPRMQARDLAAWARLSGLKDADAARLADGFLTWTRHDHGSTRMAADTRNYEYEDPPHRAPGRPIASFAELTAIAGARELFFTPDGRPTELLDDFKRSVSLHDFPAVNLNSAGPTTLRVAGLDESQIGKIIGYRLAPGSRTAGTPRYFRSLAEAQAILGPAVALAGFDTVVRCLRLHVSVREGNTVFHLLAVVAPVSEVPDAAGDGGEQPDLHYPFKVLAYEESIELASASVP